MVEVCHLLNAVLDDRVEAGNKEDTAIRSGLPRDDLTSFVALDNLGVIKSFWMNSVDVPTRMARLEPVVDRMAVVSRSRRVLPPCYGYLPYVRLSLAERTR